MDTELFDGTLPGAPSEAAYSQCGNFFQGMSVGWSDTYGSNLSGQEIPLRKLKDGDYRLYVEIDPKDRLVETNEDDNISCVLLRIGVSDLTLDILDATGCDTPGGGDPGGDETLASIAPDSAGVSETVAVVITGTGFADGVVVKFENGSGPQPKVDDFNVQNTTTITANVTVKRKGGRNPDYVWDLKVGGAVLSDAFTVNP